MKVWLADPAATEAAGAAIATAMMPRAGIVLFLRGELGAGKTTLVRGLLRALGVTGSVRSPTYTLMEPYRVGDRSVIHLDLYRITGALELVNLGLADFPAEQNWWLVEWPDRGALVLPPAHLELSLLRYSSGRVLELRAPSGPDLALIQEALERVGLPAADKLLQQ